MKDKVRELYLRLWKSPAFRRSSTINDRMHRMFMHMKWQRVVSRKVEEYVKKGTAS